MRRGQNRRRGGILAHARQSRQVRRDPERVRFFSLSTHAEGLMEPEA